MGNKKSIRAAEDLFSRDYEQEKLLGINDLKLYAYWESESSLTIIGQIFAPHLEKAFCLTCSVYDKEGDVIESCENSSYGSGLVSSYIRPGSFFDGFPFRFYLTGIKMNSVKEISIIPTYDSEED